MPTLTVHNVARDNALYDEWCRTGRGGRDSENVARMARERRLSADRIAHICYAIRRQRGEGRERAPVKERDAAILALHAKHRHRCKGGRMKIVVGSITWLGKRFGVSRSTISGVLMRARNKNKEMVKGVSEPSAPRKFSWQAVR